MKQVTITTRAVYHKTASVTIDVPPNISEDELQQWLWDNEESFMDELDTKFGRADYKYGFGLDEDNGMDWADEMSETIYDIIENNTTTYGGHI